MDKVPHELDAFLKLAAQEMASEYSRIQSRAIQDPGTAGDQGEENWAHLLRSWLPSKFRVVTKGRILGHNGKASPQVDIIVLHPSYPPLLDKTKLYLAGGVVAVFECKLTLNTNHIKSAFETAKIIYDISEKREGSPYKELTGSILFGLVAHSYSWKSDKEIVLALIDEKLEAYQNPNMTHPRNLIDFLCIADLNTWIKDIFIWHIPEIPVDPDGTMPFRTTTERPVWTGYSRQGLSNPMTIGSLLTSILYRLAKEDNDLCKISSYFESSGLAGVNSGKMISWPYTVYSEEVYKSLQNGRILSNNKWNDWYFSV